MGCVGGPAVEMCGAPGGVQTGHARRVVLTPAPRSYPYGEKGAQGKERAGRRRGVHIHGERGGGKEEGAAGVVFPWACVMKVWVSGHVLLCVRPRPSISLQIINKEIVLVNSLFASFLSY
jgi:hypothetical protein